MFWGKDGVDGRRIEGRVMSAERRRILAVAWMPWRGVDFWRPVMRIGDRKVGEGGGRTRVVREVVSWWRDGGWAILDLRCLEALNWEDVDGSEGWTEIKLLK